MKLTVYLVLLTVLLLNQSDNYRVNGNYKVILDTEFASDVQNSNYIITFSDSTYIKSFKSGKRVTGKISRLSNYIKDSKTVHLSDNGGYTPQGHLDGLIHNSFGNTQIEFEESGNDTLEFRTTYSGNLHITVNQGKLVKLK